MRKKIAVYLGLVLLALLGTVLVAWPLTPAEPELRQGMTGKDVWLILGYPTLSVGHRFREEDHSESVRFDEVHYERGPDWLGNTAAVEVQFDREHRVSDWRTTPLPRTRPPWLDQAIKAIRR